MKNKLNIKKFTLIELIIVIVVIGLLAGMALPKFIGVTKDAKVAAMDQDLDTLEKTVQLYESDNDGAEPFIKDGSGNYTKVSVTKQTLKDTLDAIGDDESSVYTLDMASLKPYLERLKYTDTTTDTYLYSTKTGVAINEQGKIDSSGITHHILNGLSSMSGGSVTMPKFTLMSSGPYTKTSFILYNNTLYGWGYNYSGQLGDNTKNDSSLPINISSLTGINFTQIVNGECFSMAIGTDGELYTWGENDYGYLGDGSGIPHYTPQKITLASGVKPQKLFCGIGSAMAIGTDGELYAWGQNNYGNLGDGTKTHRYSPVKISLPNGVKPKQIASSGHHSMAIGDDGEFYAWGRNSNGQLGTGTSDYDHHYAPQKIILPNGVKPLKIACGESFSMAICTDGELYTWGDGSYGELGNGSSSYTNYPTPTKVILPNGVKPKQISAGHNFAVTICDDGNSYAWGNNGGGALGDNTIDDKSVPTKIILPDNVKLTQVSCGEQYSWAMGNDENLYGWGWNNSGQLGDGTKANILVPTKINFDFK